MKSVYVLPLAVFLLDLGSVLAPPPPKAVDSQYAGDLKADATVQVRGSFFGLAK
jgi:hypothetical protein